MAIRDEDEKIAWERYHEKPLKTEFEWDKVSSSKADTLSGVHHSIDTGITPALWDQRIDQNW